MLAGMLVGASAPNPASICGDRHSTPSCTRELNAQESQALRAIAERLVVSRSAACEELGSFIIRHAADARVLPYPIRTPVGIATGDAHVVEHPLGTGRVHVADSVWTREGALARPLRAKVRSMVHDFAHIALGLPQYNNYLSTDAADDAVTRCVHD
jgi:hypothetical protein